MVEKQFQRDEEPVRILSLADPTMFADGTAIGFTLNSTGGPARVTLAAANIGNVIVFLIGCARSLGERFGQPDEQAPIPMAPATRIAFGQGLTPDTTAFVVDVCGLRLGFDVSSDELVSMADELGRVARTLSATGQPQ